MTIALALLAAVAAPFALMALFVNDWSRDLTTNRAHTGPGEKATPWEAPGATPERVAGAARAIGAAGGAWRLAEELPLRDDSPLPTIVGAEQPTTHHFVRTTGLMRYRDDVWLVVAPGGDGVRLFAESRSRVGKGDLGQNPRNLAELRRLIDAELEKI